MRYARGDQRAGEELSDRLYSDVHTFFLRYSARLRNRVEVRDLVQDTFVAFLTSIRRYPDRVSEIRSVSHYILGVARRTFVRHMRSRDFIVADDGLVEDSLWDMSDELDSMLHERHKYIRFLHALHALSFEQRELLQLYYWDRLRAKDIGVIFGIPETTVRTQAHAARQKLKEALDSMETPSYQSASESETRHLLQLFYTGPAFNDS